MVRLPDPTDYGARPSLQSNRRDRPSTGGVALAESLTQAANVFAQEVEKRQKKQDALNYALARNDILIADIEARKSLEDNPNWREYDNLYTEAFKTNSEAARRKYKLDPADSALLDAEINLIRARGRVDVGGQAKKMEIGEGVANLNAGLSAATENIINQRPGHRNHLILGQLEAIEAAREKGYLTAPEAEAMRQSFTQEIATKVLETVDPSEKVEMLEATLKYRRGGDPKDKDFTASDTGQGPISIDDIRAGKGTGSVADFLHTDTAAKMLRSAWREDKENMEKIAAQEAQSRATAMFPQDYMARRRWIRDNYEGAVEDRALSIINEEENIRNTQRDRAGQQAYEDRAMQIVNRAISEAGPMTKEELLREVPDSEWVLMGPAKKQSLLNEIDNRLLGIQFAPYTQYRDKGDGTMSLDGWKKLNDYGEEGEKSKVSVDLDSPEWRQAFDRETWYLVKAEQDQLKAALNTEIPIPDVNSLVTKTLNAYGWGGKTDAHSKNTMSGRMNLWLRGKIGEAQQSKKPPGRLADSEIQNLINQYMLTSYDTKTGWWGIGVGHQTLYDATQDEVADMMDSVEALEEVPAGQNPEAAGHGNWRQILTSLAEPYGVEPSEEDMRRALAQYKMGMGKIAFGQALVGSKYGGNPAAMEGIYDSIFPTVTPKKNDEEEAAKTMRSYR